MKIAQVAPLYEAVPPERYGGTERIIAYLVDALVDQGHEVTLFASGDAKTKGKLVNCREKALWLDENTLGSENAAHLAMLHEVRRRAHEFDIVHFHIELLAHPVFEEIAARTLTTLHGRLDLSDYQQFFKRWPQFPLASISDAQRKPLPSANWAGTVHHGLPLHLFAPAPEPSGGYVAFVGRFSPEKQAHVAIKVAQRAGKTVRLGARKDQTNMCYFRETVEPLFTEPGVEYMGEVADGDKRDLLASADALLFPVAWPEPFGLVMIEAMACGTPVVAWNCGAVPEVIEHGVTGFVVNSEEEAAEALGRVKELDRDRIRAEFERRFSASRMAGNYAALYHKLADEAPPKIAAGMAVPADAVGSAEPITVESEESTMPYKLLALKDVDTFTVANSLGDIIGKGDGLFHNDTRVLSEFRMLLGGKPPSLLSATISQDNVYFNAHITNRPLPPLGETAIPEGIIHIERSRFIWKERMYEHVQLVNYGESSVSAPIEFHFRSDFRDIFEVRGQRRPARGELQAPAIHDNHVVLSYRSRDGMLHESVVAFSQAPDLLTESSAQFRFSLPRKQTMDLYLEIGPAHEGTPTRQRFRDAAAQARRCMRKRRHGGGRLRASEHIFDSWLERSRSDLALLTTDLPTGPYPYAGIPWFSTPFGRDAVITALQMLWFEPRIAEGVLRFLAHHQTDETSSFRDAAPGKIMHETRKGEMSRLGEVPFALYYGGVDTTPLFVVLAGAYAHRTANMTFIDEIWPALQAAMDWIEDIGDSNKDGFLDYQSGETTGLRNQGWKDSEDSVFHANGQFPVGPIALVEVQGYKYGAMRAMADMASHRGEIEVAKQWRTRAREMANAVDDNFWMEDKGFYGLALDGNGDLCKVRASNAGHLLYMGLPPADRAAKVIQQLLSSSFDSGWGIRTLATDEQRYNPMSYHNGSVWPHDTAICAAGMARYGERSGAAHILSELFGAAVHFGMRLPELYCGFQRMPGDAPVAYPVACLPQAWSSGSVFMTLQACLGVSIDAWRKEIHIDRPELPDGINQIALKDLKVGDVKVNVVFQRVRDRVTVFTEGNSYERVKVLTRL